MSLSLSIHEILPHFPQARIALVRVDAAGLAAPRSAALDMEIAAREARCRARFDGIELSAIPGIGAWRRAYRGFGIRKTSYRSSVERLVKRVLAGERLPAVNTLVDLYNAVSLEHVLCCGADDLDRIAPPLAFRFARAGDTFLDMGSETAEDDPPKQGEVVYADERHVLCRRWNWRQDARTGISSGTRRAVVTLQSNGEGDLEAALADFAALLREHVGGEIQAAIADSERPEVTIFGG